MEAFDLLDGGLLVDKPSGPTSHDVVDRIRRRFGIKKVGHAGTLDPAATHRREAAPPGDLAPWQP